jgi:hypothetical protein
VSVTIQQCEKFPLAELDPATASSDPGRLEVVMSMTKLHLGNPTMVKVLDQVASFAGADFAEQSLQGEIKEAHVVMEKGTVKQDVTIATGENGREIRIAGGANLLTSELVDMNFYIGPQFLKQWGGDLPKFFPEGLPIALSGTTRSVHFDVQRQITQGLGKLLTPATLGKIIGGFTSKKNDRDKRKASPTPNAGASPPATPGSDATTAKSAQPATPAQAKEPEQAPRPAPPRARAGAAASATAEGRRHAAHPTSATGEEAQEEVDWGSPFQQGGRRGAVRPDPRGG